ncbi:hypothetical protein VTI74DRAFT_1098 [Chaetomium olivicolor]
MLGGCMSWIFFVSMYDDFGAGDLGATKKGEAVLALGVPWVHYGCLEACWTLGDVQRVFLSVYMVKGSTSLLTLWTQHRSSKNAHRIRRPLCFYHWARPRRADLCTLPPTDHSSRLYSPDNGSLLGLGEHQASHSVRLIASPSLVCTGSRKPEAGRTQANQGESSQQVVSRLAKLWGVQSRSFEAEIASRSLVSVIAISDPCCLSATRCIGAKLHRPGQVASVPATSSSGAGCSAKDRIRGESRSMCVGHGGGIRSRGTGRDRTPMPFPLFWPGYRGGSITRRQSRLWHIIPVPSQWDQSFAGKAGLLHSSALHERISWASSICRMPMPMIRQSV